MAPLTHPLKTSSMIQRIDEYMDLQDSVRFSYSSSSIRSAVTTNKKKWAQLLVDSRVKLKFGGKDPAKFFKQYWEHHKFENKLERAYRAGMKIGPEVYINALHINALSTMLNVLIPAFQYACSIRRGEEAGSDISPPDRASTWSAAVSLPMFFALCQFMQSDRMTVWVNGRAAFHREPARKLIVGAIGIMATACGVYFVSQGWLIKGVVTAGSGTFLAFRGFTSYKFMVNFCGEQSGRCNQVYTRYVRARQRVTSSCTKKMKNTCENLTNGVKQVGQFLGRGLLFLARGAATSIEDVFHRAFNFGV